MELTRREILALTVLTMAGCDCRDAAVPATKPSGDRRAPAIPATAPTEAAADAGPLADYAADGVYDAFREQGFFLIRRDGRLWALSSICTHKGCKVRTHADRSFFCRCHRSAFDPDGVVLSGPAKRDMPRLLMRLDEQRHVRVNLNIDAGFTRA